MLGHTKKRARSVSGWRERFRLTGAALLLMVPLAACDTFDSLLEVSLPGNIVDGDLNDPVLAEAIVGGVQAQFECALQGHRTQIDGLWAQEYHGNFSRPRDLSIEQRSSEFQRHGELQCTHSQMRSYSPMQVARNYAESSAARLADAERVPNLDNRAFLVGKSLFYQAYATQLLSEAFCGIVFDGDGNVRPREEGFQTAAGLFTQAMEQLGQATGVDLAEAQALTTASRVGRARARLNAGDHAGALSDAEQVPFDFVYYATYDDDGGSFRSNRNSQAVSAYTLHWRYRNLTIDDNGVASQADGVWDPRVVSDSLGLLRGVDWWVAYKLAPVENIDFEGRDVPLATGREALLMVAEIQGGQAAVGIINELRATVDQAPYVFPEGPHPREDIDTDITYDLPEFQSTDEAEIFEALVQERRRELFQQHTKLGDDLRWGRDSEWDTGLTPSGRPYAGDSDCMFIPDVEFL